MQRERKTILLCVLNWGIGHAARCIPLINRWINEQKRVVIASDGSALQMLQAEFPFLEFEKLPSYSVEYPAGQDMVTAMALQLPKFIKVIRAENSHLEGLTEQYKPEMIVSDSRFGCYSTKVKSIFITHQLNLIMPGSFRWMQSAVNFFNHRQINHYSECWVPDVENEPDSLGGRLSHPSLPNASYIGPLSRFKTAPKTEKIYDIVAVLSGPEPQRTVLEELLLKQMEQSNLRCLLVQGLPQHTAFNAGEHSIPVVPYLTTNDLAQTISSAKLLICRSGYSTIMDLDALKPDTAIAFIPTPGQTEQEYLAKRLHNNGFALSYPQSGFNLQQCWADYNLAN